MDDFADVKQRELCIRSYALEIKRILEYYIDNDEEAYKKVQSLPINCYFILLTTIIFKAMQKMI